MIDIKNYERLYSVEEDGRIYSHISNKYLKPMQRNKKQKYTCVDLRKNKKRKSVYIHRIVAESFLPNPNDLPQVNHIDGDPTNNSVENLEWCDNSYNASHAFKLGLRCQKGEKHPNNKLTANNVVMIKALLKAGMTHKDIVYLYKVDRTTITSINRGINWKNV